MLRQIYLKQVSEKEGKVEEEKEFTYDKTRSKRIPGRSQVIGNQDLGMFDENPECQHAYPPGSHWTDEVEDLIGWECKHCHGDMILRRVRAGSNLVPDRFNRDK